MAAWEHGGMLTCCSLHCLHSDSSARRLANHEPRVRRPGQVQVQVGQVPPVLPVLPVLPKVSQLRETFSKLSCLDPASPVLVLVLSPAASCVFASKPRSSSNPRVCIPQRPRAARPGRGKRPPLHPAHINIYPPSTYPAHCAAVNAACLSFPAPLQPLATPSHRADQTNRLPVQPNTSIFICLQSALGDTCKDPQRVPKTVITGILVEAWLEQRLGQAG